MGFYILGFQIGLLGFIREVASPLILYYPHHPVQLFKLNVCNKLVY